MGREVVQGWSGWAKDLPACLAANLMHRILFEVFEAL